MRRSTRRYSSQRDEFGLTQPGVQVTFKLYVMLTTGNEAGSAPMQVQRPFSAVA